MAFFTSAQYSAAIVDGQRGIELLSRSGDPYLTFIAEYHGGVAAMRLGNVSETMAMLVSGFERGAQLGEDASCGPMISGIALATEGNYPYPLLRACYEIREDNHFSAILTGQSEGLWHLRFGRLAKAVEALQRAWTRAVRHCLFVPSTANLLLSLVTAQRCYAETLDTGSRERMTLLSRAWRNARLAGAFSRLYASERAYVLREQGLLLTLKGAKRRGTRRLLESAEVAQSHGDIYQRAITLVEL